MFNPLQVKKAVIFVINGIAYIGDERLSKLDTNRNQKNDSSIIK